MPLFVAKTKHPDGRIRVDDILDFSGGVQNTPVYWNQIQNKPTTFPPSQHNHEWDDITNKPSTFPPSQHNHPWNEITNIPSTFPPSSHTHPWNDITNPPSQYPPSPHTHTKSEITNLETITTTPTANAIPKADSNGRISLGWFDLSNYATLNGNNTFTGSNSFRTINITPQTTSEIPFTVKSIQSIAPLGSELIQNGSFTSDAYWTWGTGWVWDSTNQEADHQKGNTAPLTQNISVISGRKYLITFTMWNRTAGSVSITLGDAQAYGTGGATSFGGNATYQAVVTPTSSGSLTLAFTPASDFNGSIDDVSVKEILATQPHIVSVDTNNSTSLEIRSDATNESIGIGRNALSYILGSGKNVAIGSLALTNNTLGTENVAIGFRALANNITGYANVAIGLYALLNNTYGNDNVALGSYALYSNATGNGNFGLGQSALYFVSSGNNNIAIGLDAGKLTSTGANNSSMSSSIMIGYNTRPLSNDDTNEIVIGHQAIGGGSNSVVIGNDNITKTYLKGKLAIGYTGTLPNTHSYLQPNGSVAFPITSTDSDLTLTDAHYTVLVNASGGNRTITLPSATGINGRIYVVKKIDSSINSVVIQAQTGQTIDGRSSFTLSSQYATVIVQAYGGNWYVISKI